MTSGGKSGPDGAWLLAAYLAAAAAVIGLLTAVNISTRLHDAPELGRAGRAWTVLLEEGSSGVAAALLTPASLWLLRAFPPLRHRWRRFLAVQAAASVAFAVLHVTGFVWLRKLGYGLAGEAYRFGGLGEFLYEYRKDAFAYAIGVALFSGAEALLRRPRSIEATPSVAEPLVLREGGRTLRVAPGEVLAATAAGNYVEYRLADGRRPLVRTTLALAEAELAPHGIVRTHRSWLVNAAAVREIAPSGSGDHRLTLSDGSEAPLSRRFEEALARLRG